LEENATVSVSGWIVEGKDQKREIEYFGETIPKSSILTLVHRPKLSSVMFMYRPEIVSWFLDDFLACIYVNEAVLNESLAFTNSATVVVKSYLTAARYDEEKQIETLRDSIRYNPKFNSHSDGVTSTSIVLTDELLIRTLKRILWNFFSKYPRFQRTCQKSYRFIKGVVK
jgi:hypothetical protein